MSTPAHTPYDTVSVPLLAGKAALAGGYPLVAVIDEGGWESSIEALKEARGCVGIYIYVYVYYGGVHAT